MHVCQYAVLPANGSAHALKEHRPSEPDLNESALQQTLYERIGGHEPIEATLLRFHKKGSNHSFLKKWFEDVPDSVGCGQLRSFMIIGFGGPDADESIYLRESYQDMIPDELTSEVFDSMLDLFAESMEELDIVSDVVGDVMRNLRTIGDDSLVC